MRRVKKALGEKLLTKFSAAGAAGGTVWFANEHGNDLLTGNYAQIMGQRIHDGMSNLGAPDMLLNNTQFLQNMPEWSGPAIAVLGLFGVMKLVTDVLEDGLDTVFKGDETGKTGVFLGMGTSLPELFTILKSLQLGAAGLAVGTIVGSNSANVSAIMGLPVLAVSVLTLGAGGIILNNLSKKKKQIRQKKGKEIPGTKFLGLGFGWLMASTAAFIAIFGGLAEQLKEGGDLNLYAGYGLLGALAVYVGTQLFKKPDPRDVDHDEEVEEMPDAVGRVFGFGFAAAAVAGIYASVEMVVPSLLALGETLNWSDAITGTASAIGTSAPEMLAIAALFGRASKKGTTRAKIKSSRDVISNITSSGIFNALMIGGVALVASAKNGLDAGPSFDINEPAGMLGFGAMFALPLIPITWLKMTGGKIGAAGALVMSAAYIGLVTALYNVGSTTNELAQSAPSALGLA